MTEQDRLDIMECLDELDGGYRDMCYGAPQDVEAVPLEVELKSMKRDFVARATPTMCYEVRNGEVRTARKGVTIEVRRGPATLIQATGLSFLGAMHGAKEELEGLP